MLLVLIVLLLLSHRLDSAHLESQLGVNGLHLHIKFVSIYRKMLIYQYRFCVGLTPIAFLFPLAPRHSRGRGIKKISRRQTSMKNYSVGRVKKL